MRVIVSILLIAVLGLYSLPYLIRDQAVIWLKAQGVENVTFEKVDIHWLSGTVELLNLKADSQVNHKADSEKFPPIRVGHLKVTLDYRSLFDKRILINEFILSDVASGLYQQGDDLWLGPVNLSQFNSEKAVEEPAGPPSEWRVGLANVSLKNINWSLNLPQHQQQVVIDNAALSSLQQWDAKASTQITLSGLINGSRIELNSDSVPLPDQKTSTIKLVLDHFPLQSVAKAWVPQLQGYLTTNLELKLDLNAENGLFSHSGSFSVDEFSWKDKQMDVTDKHLHWSGKGSVELADSALQNVSLDGALQTSDIRLEQGKELAMLMSQLNWKGALNLNFTDQAISTIKGEQQLSMSDVTFRQADLNVSAASLIQEGPLDLLLSNNLPKQLSSPVSLKVASLKLNNAQLDLAATQLSLVSPLKVSWKKSGAGAELGALSATPVISLQQLRLSQGGRLAVALKSAEVAAVLADMSVSQPVVEKVSLKAFELSVSTLKEPLQLVELNSIGLVNGFYSTKKISADQLTFSELKTNYKQGQQPMSAIGELQLKELLLTELNRLIIKNARIKNTQTYVSVTTKSGIKEVDRLTLALETLNENPQQGKENNVKTTTQSESKDAAFSVRVGQLLVTGKNLINIQDHSVKPVFKSIVDVQELKVEKFDTATGTNIKGELSPFTLQASINTHAKLSASGKMNLLGGGKNGNWQLDLKNAELPVVSPYAGKYVGYFLQSGQMDFSSSGTLKAGVLAGENRIKLNRLEVQPAQTQATDEFNTKLSMPLGTAISVLQDSDDNIKLDLPVDGSLDDPKFGYQDIINRLATKGLKKAAFSFLTKSLQPYGALISLASTAIDANKSGAFITLAPVTFDAGQSTAAADMKGYLDKIGEMMTSRKGLRLNICGNAVKEDRVVVLPLLEKENKAKAKPLPAAELEVIVLERLQGLAVARGEQVTSALLDKGVAKDRLFSCFPVPNLKNGELKPGVELAL